MGKKKHLTGRDKELQELADRYEAAKQEGKSIYMDAEDFADLADWYLLHRKYAEADDVVEYGLGIHPCSTPLLLEAVNICLEVQEVDKAKEIIEQVGERSDEVTIVKADLLYMEGHPRKAEALLDTLEEKDDLFNIIDVAYLFLDNGYPKKAHEWLKRGEGLYDDDEAYIAAKGDCFLATGQPEEGIKCFNALIDRVPYSASFWYGLARCYFDTEAYDKVIEACDYVTVIDEEFGDAYMLRAAAFSALGNEEKAMENYLQAEKCHIVPHSFIDGIRGVNCVAKGEWEEGLSHFERALKAKDKNHPNQFPKEELYYHAAECLTELENFGKAHQYCKKAQRLTPDDSSPYILEGIIYLMEDNDTKARDMWDMAFDLNPTTETMYEIAMQCAERGFYEIARIFFKSIRQLDPDFENINEYLASVCVMMDDMEGFLEYNRLSKSPLKANDVKRVKELLDDMDGGAALSEVVAKVYRTLDSHE